MIRIFQRVRRYRPLIGEPPLAGAPQTAVAGIAIVTVTARSPVAHVTVPAGVAVVTVTALGIVSAQDQTGNAGVAIVLLYAPRPTTAQTAECHAVNSCAPSDSGYSIATASSATTPADCELVNACPPSDYGYSAH